MKHHLASVIAALGLILGSGSAHALLIGFSGDAPTVAPSGFGFETEALQGTIEFDDAALVAGATNFLGIDDVTSFGASFGFGLLSWSLGDSTAISANLVLDSRGSFESLVFGAFGPSGILSYDGPNDSYSISPSTTEGVISGTAGYNGVRSVPEPPTVLLFLAGLAGLAGVLSWRQRVGSRASKRAEWDNIRA